MMRLIILVSSFLVALPVGHGLAQGRTGHNKVTSTATTDRRAMLASTFAMIGTSCVIPTKAANARLVLNDDGEYDEIEETDWQTAWKQRLDKAQSMSTDEIFMAARGAGNTDLREGPESDASKKRRAMAGCRDTSSREKAGVKDSKVCTTRVLEGEVDFMLNVL
mmetsp:Transcript_3306/g.4847  ORF Transcript_3306/g.4847 Transcript_3306/m.4847 type:complete len:164 (-) Transcript_3306:640-1131(-)